MTASAHHHSRRPAPPAHATPGHTRPRPPQGTTGGHPGRARRAVAGTAIALLPLLAATVAVAGPPRSPMAIARGLHAARLALGGATVVRYPAAQLQQAANDCGVAVTRELARLHHRTLPDAALHAALPLTPHGISLDALATGLAALGHPGTVLRHAWDTPLHPHDIVLLRSRHYVLLLAASPRVVRYYDPMVGLVQRPRTAFRDDWTGKLIRLRS
jgi:hypothetical protein